MSRLHHEVKAYLASLKMTRTDLIIFMEGKENDPVLYSKVKAQYEQLRNVTVEVRRGQELPGSAPVRQGGSGGKAWLTRAGEFWDRYRDHRGQRHRCRLVFALDKDVDDLFGRLRTSSSFVYTPGYSVENSLFTGTDLLAALTSAFSLLPSELSSILGNKQATWISRTQQLWLEWTVFCVLERAYPRTNMRGYGIPSKLNKPRHATSDHSLFLKEAESLRTLAGADEADFHFVLDNVSALIRSELNSGQADKYFKGDWYVDVLFSQIQADPTLRSRCSQIGKNGMWAAIRASYQLEPRTFSHYRDAFDRALS